MLAWKPRMRPLAWDVMLGCARCRCDTVAHMPCNPAIGGTAKGHLVREIDALGGLMGRAIDATGIQFKLLNRSRGPAVWSPRAQADKKLYARWVRNMIGQEPNIEWIFARAGRVLTMNGRVEGLALEDGERLECSALVVTTGTFLNGLIHEGRERRSRAGRVSRLRLSSLSRSGAGISRWDVSRPGPRRVWIAGASISIGKSSLASFIEERGDPVSDSVLLSNTKAAREQNQLLASPHE